MPVEINTLEDFLNIWAGAVPMEPVLGDYIQMADIDCAGATLNYPAFATFGGSYDGNGFKFSNFKIDSMAYPVGPMGTVALAGLFGAISGGYISNLTINNADIKAQSGTVGTAAGGICSMSDDTMISNCRIVDTSISIYGGDVGAAGAVAGYLGSAMVEDVVATGCTVSAPQDIGGFAGLIDNGADLQKCAVVNATLTGTHSNPQIGDICSMGGFAAECNYSKINNAFVKGTRAYYTGAVNDNSMRTFAGFIPWTGGYR